MADEITKMYQETGSDPLPEYVEELKTSYRPFYGSQRLKAEELLKEKTKVYY